MSANPAFSGVSSLISKEMILSQLGAKALATIVLTVLFGIRASLRFRSLRKTIEREQPPKVKTQ
jgi:hypothetical protein